MAVCNNCRTEFTGKFCPTCGASAQVGPAPIPVQAAPRVAPPVYTNVVAAPPASTATSVWGWIGWMFLIACLPLLGVIIMALAANDESAKNFAKAQLVLMLIGAIIGLIIAAICILIPIIMGASANAG